MVGSGTVVLCWRFHRHVRILGRRAQAHTWVRIHFFITPRLHMRLTGQLAEEVHEASIVVPRSTIASTILNGSLGFAMVIATLFCMGDIDTTIYTPTGFPYMEVFLHATGTKNGATLMASVIIALCVFVIVGALATASRMLWAFAREKGLPGHNILVKVSTAFSFYGKPFTNLLHDRFIKELRYLSTPSASLSLSAFSSVSSTSAPQPPSTH